MKIKLKLSLISSIFLLVIIFCFTTNSFASDKKFDFGVEEQEHFIWKCEVCEKEKMKELLGKDWNQNISSIFNDIGKSKKMKLLVNEINDDLEVYNSETNEFESFLVLEYKKWTWTEADNWEAFDYRGQYIFYANPKDYPNKYIFPDFFPLYIPVPFEDYIKEINLHKGYSIDTRSRIFNEITCKINQNELHGNYPTASIQIQAKYDKNGVLTSYKLYIENHEVFLEITLVKESNKILEALNPFIPIIIAVIYVGLIYVIYKKLISS